MAGYRASLVDAITLIGTTQLSSAFAYGNRWRKDATTYEMVDSNRQHVCRHVSICLIKYLHTIVTDLVII